MEFISPESTYTPDNSPQMRFNNLCLELGSLPQGEHDARDEKARIHAELIRIANSELKGEEQEKAIAAANELLERCLSSQ